jgi:hypothetical protein
MMRIEARFVAGPGALRANHVWRLEAVEGMFVPAKPTNENFSNLDQ